MTRGLRVFAYLAACTVIWSLSGSTGRAAGALAVGACAAYGYALDYADVEEANAEAVRKCAAPECRVVMNLKRNCGAFAIDARRPCGAHGYASAKRLALAQNRAMKACHQYGGKDCVIRAFACDGKG